MPLDQLPQPASLFAPLSEQPLDAMLTLLNALRGDTRPGKIDLGIGVYRNDRNQTPVMRAVKAAEAHLVATQDSKDYISPEGDMGYIAHLAPVVFGEAGAREARRLGMQTPGGTAALRLAAALIGRANPQARVWISQETWPNHALLMHAADLQVVDHPYFDRASQTVQFDAMMSAMEAARPGDVWLLQACCHNPTGADLTPDQWRAVAALAARKGLIPLIDMAYQGLGHSLDDDAAGMRMVIDAVPEAFVAVSGSKNFGLYRDRVGALWLQADTAATARRARSNLIVLARTLWSMPPDHGAAVVRTILSDHALTAMWRSELDEMRRRIQTLRAGLAAALPSLGAIARQNGMFSLLPLDRDEVLRLRADHAIYMLKSGRINIAGLQSANLPVLCTALRPYL